jgi:hypothetical protein
MVDEAVPVYFPTKIFQIILIVINIARRGIGWPPPRFTECLPEEGVEEYFGSWDI